MTATKCPPALLRWYKWARRCADDGYALDSKEFHLLRFCERTYPKECQP